MNKDIKPTKRNPVWDALVDVFGAPTTESNRRLRGKIVRSLNAADATYDQVVERALSWPLHFPGATLTETALEKHWDRLGRPPLRSNPSLDRAVQRHQDELEVRRRLK